MDINPTRDDGFLAGRAFLAASVIGFSLLSAPAAAYGHAKRFDRPDCSRIPDVLQEVRFRQQAATALNRKFEDQHIEYFIQGITKCGNRVVVYFQTMIEGENMPMGLVVIDVKTNRVSVVLGG
jgi:hypothetical protein